MRCLLYFYVYLFPVLQVAIVLHVLCPLSALPVHVLAKKKEEKKSVFCPAHPGGGGGGFVLHILPIVLHVLAVVLQKIREGVAREGKGGLPFPSLFVFYFRTKLNEHKQVYHPQSGRFL